MCGSKFGPSSKILEWFRQVFVAEIDINNSPSYNIILHKPRQTPHCVSFIIFCIFVFMIFGT